MPSFCRCAADLFRVGKGKDCLSQGGQITLVALVGVTVQLQNFEKANVAHMGREVLGDFCFLFWTCYHVLRQKTITNARPEPYYETRGSAG